LTRPVAFRLLGAEKSAARLVVSRTLSTTPRQDGFRAPGELEPKAGCWLIWPERPDTWRLGAKPAQKLFTDVATAISHSEPVTVVASGRQWMFDKVGVQAPKDLDDLLAQKVLEVERMDRYRSPLIAEGGGLQSDGQDTLITTEQCLLNRNRNGHLGKPEVERQLQDYLGVESIIWLPRGFAFDETDGHVDDICCFVRPGVVALSWTDDRADPQY